LGMLRHNSIPELGLEILGDSTVRIASNLEKGGLATAVAYRRLKIFLGSILKEIDALGDLMGLDLGKKGENGKKRVKMITLFEGLVPSSLGDMESRIMMSKNLVS